MKIIVTEAHIEKIMNELDITSHSKKRMNLRLFDQNTYDVVAFPTSPFYNKIIIGKYKIPQEARNNVNMVFDKIIKPEYKIPLGTALVIKLYEFKIKLDDIIFNGDIQQQKRFKKMFGDRQNWNIYLQTPMDENGRTSHGRFLVCIAVENVVSTTILIRNTKDSFEDLKEHTLRNHPEINNVIYIDNPESQFDIYNVNNPKNSIEQPELISDKEKRLLAYKEKMKRNFGQS